MSSVHIYLSNRIVLLIFFQHFATAQKELIEPVLLGTIPTEDEAGRSENKILISTNRELFILVNGDLVVYNLEQNRFRSVLRSLDIEQVPLTFKGMQLSSRYNSIWNFSLDPQNRIYIEDWGSYGMVMDNNTISVINCHKLGANIENCLGYGFYNLTFNNRGSGFVVTNIQLHDPSAKPDQNGLFQYHNSSELTLYAGGGDNSIGMLTPGGDPIHRFDALLSTIKDMKFFDNTLFFMNPNESTVYKLTSDGWFHSMGTAYDFTVYSENTIIIYGGLGDPRYAVYFSSPNLLEPIFITVIPEITKNRGRNLGMAYDKETDDLYVSVLDYLDIALWKVPDISRVLQTHIQDWKNYE